MDLRRSAIAAAWSRRTAGVGRRVWVAALLVGAVLEGLVCWRIGWTPALPAYCYLAAVGAVLAVLDLATRLIPNVVVLPSYPVVAALLVVASATDAQWGALTRAAIAMLLLAGIFLALGYLPGMAVGGGDVKLAGLLGLALGWLGWPAVVDGIAAELLLDFAGVVVLVLVRREGTRVSHPGAPFLVAGAFLAILAVR